MSALLSVSFGGVVFCQCGGGSISFGGVVVAMSALLV